MWKYEETGNFGFFSWPKNFVNSLPTSMLKPRYSLFGITYCPQTSSQALTIAIMFKTKGDYNLIWLIPQGTIDNNLGPDRLEGPKALYPIIADNQPLSGSPNCA